jgi:hypothetical protein
MSEIEVTGMNFPEKGRIEWNLNTIVMIGGIFLATLANVAIAAISWNDTKRDIQEIQEQVKSETQARQARGLVTDGRFTDLNKAVAEIAPLSFQVTRVIEASAENKKGVEAANDRIDRVVESIGGKLDTVIENVNKLATRVEVFGSKLDDQAARTNKTLFRTPIIRP